jgi:ABC-type uncharacterized transport system involved in gliding motility auxiliary subunit
MGGMRLFFVLVKKELFSLCVQPFALAASFVFSAVCAARYFYAGFFFDAAGSSDLRLYFSFIPYALIFVVPALTMSLWEHIEFDETLPARDGVLVLAKWFSSLCAFCAFLAPSVAVPAAVSFFGDVDVPLVLTSFAGIICFASSALALGTLTAFVVKNRAASFAVTALVLALSNSAHLIALYLGTGGLLGAILRAVSFAWHFDSASKGIIDARDIAFFAALTWLFLMLNTLSLEKRRAGKRPSFFFARTLVFITAFLTLASSSRFPLAVDVSRAKRFSISRFNEDLLMSLDAGALSITYYVSPELSELYPQTKNIGDFLHAFAAKGKNAVLLTTVNPQNESAEFLSRAGITGRSVNRSQQNRLEYVTVYSGIVVEYLNRTETIPFILSSDNLEYELARRILNVLNGSKPLVYVVAGNELSAEIDYSYALAWLENAGFMPVVLTPDALEAAEGDLLSPQGIAHPLALFGSNILTAGQAQIIERFMLAGGNVFCAVSPNTVDLLAEWKAENQKDDAFIPILKNWGIEIGDGMVHDISCFRLTLQTEEGGSQQFVYKNYPLWITTLPQFTPPHILFDFAIGLNVFWASPLYIAPNETNAVTEFLRSSPASWIAGGEGGFITNPFLLPATGDSRGGTDGYVLCAMTETNVSKLIVLASQYFASNAALEYTSNTQNLDYLVAALMALKGEENLLALKRRQTNTALYKMNAENLALAKIPTLVFTAVIIPLVVPACVFFTVNQMRRRNKNPRKEKKQ